jgi:hypothetical protein
MLGLSTAPATAAEWQLAASTDDFTTWIDVASLSRSNGIVKAWLKRQHNAPRPLYEGSAESYSSARLREYYKCASRESATKSVAYFTEGDLGGQIVYKLDEEDSELKWAEEAPETVGEMLLHFACSKAPKQ